MTARLSIAALLQRHAEWSLDQMRAVVSTTTTTVPALDEESARALLAYWRERGYLPPSDDATARAERAEGQRDEMRALLATAIDVITLPGHAFARSAWDQACLLAGRYSDENLRHDFGKLARAERAEGQLAALRVAARETLIAYGGEGDPLGAALEAALDDGAQAAEAHDRRVRAEALREAAEALGGRMQVDDEVGEWLRARADEIERGD